MLDDTDPEQRVLGLTLGYRLLEACDELRSKEAYTGNQFVSILPDRARGHP